MGFPFSAPDKETPHNKPTIMLIRTTAYIKAPFHDTCSFLKFVDSGIWCMRDCERYFSANKATLAV